tara:strand:- start:110 stop:1705 length:1596 start_codon:yes stop_codon:yes gene_type:complete
MVLAMGTPRRAKSASNLFHAVKSKFVAGTPPPPGLTVQAGSTVSESDKSERTKAQERYTGSFRWKVFQTFENPDYREGPWPKSTAKVISLIVMATILVSTLAFILESEACTPSSFLSGNPSLEVLLVIEVFSVTIFSMEYVSRLLCCPRLCGFFWTPLNLVDLLAILPFYLGLILSKGELDPYECRDDYDKHGNWLNATEMLLASQEEEDSGVPNLGFLRVVRLVRIFRVFKFGKYSLGLQMFVGCLKSSTQPLGIIAVMLVIASTVFGAIINIFEATTSSYSGMTGDIEGYLEANGRGAETHDMCFGTIIRGYWWAFVTMTTVGYGDCYPVTPVGKMVTGVTMIFGILSLALPITVIGSNFAKMVEVFAEEAAELGAADLDGTGMIDEFELRTFISQKKKENQLVPGVDTNAARLMERFDESDKGHLNPKEFARLQEEIISPQDKAMGTLEQVGISVAFQEETSRQTTASLHAMRKDLDSFVLSQGQRLAGIEATLQQLGTRMEAIASGDPPLTVTAHRRGLKADADATG